MRLRPTLIAPVICAACVTLPDSSAWTPGAPAPPAACPARVAWLADPGGAEEIAVVETHGPRPGTSLQALVAGLAARAASVGGDVVRVDRFATRYETRTETYTYDCRVSGVAGAPCVCGTTPVTTTVVRVAARTDPDGTLRNDLETVTVTKDEPTSCTATRDVEVAVMSLVGRAFRTKGGSR